MEAEDTKLRQQKLKVRWVPGRAVKQKRSKRAHSLP